MVRPWEEHFNQASQRLKEFYESERAWLRGIGDPRFYHRDRESNCERYLAVFPAVPWELNTTLHSALSSACAGLDAVIHSLLPASLDEKCEEPVFPFASSRAEFFSPPRRRQMNAFTEDVREVLTHVAPYPDGDDLLHALHAVATQPVGQLLAPYATIPDLDPPKIGSLRIDPAVKGAVVKTEVEADANMEVPGAGAGWNHQTMTLLIAKWTRSPNIHVEAKVRAWIVFAASDLVPRHLHGAAAYAKSASLIARAEGLAYDLSGFSKTHDRGRS